MYTSDARQRPAPVWVRLPTFESRATNIMLGVLVLIYLAEVLAAGGAQEPPLAVLIKMGAKENSRIINGDYWRLLTAMFLHGNLLHIGFNGYALLAFGQQIERFYGAARFLAIYFIGGLLGSIASFVFSPLPSVGASGAIMGILGAVCIFFWLQRRLLGTVARTQLWPALVSVVLILVMGISQAGVVDNMAHAGGFVGGLVAAWALAPRYRPGRPLGPDEQMLEDRFPAWGVLAASMAMLAAELLLFAAALFKQSGAG